MNNGDTVLHSYLKEGKFDLAKCFIAQARKVGFEIDLTVKNSDGKTITACAREYDAPHAIIQLLTAERLTEGLRSASP